MSRPSFEVLEKEREIFRTKEEASLAISWAVVAKLRSLSFRVTLVGSSRALRRRRRKRNFTTNQIDLSPLYHATAGEIFTIRCFLVRVQPFLKWDSPRPWNKRNEEKRRVMKLIGGLSEELALVVSTETLAREENSLVHLARSSLPFSWIPFAL